MVTLGDYAARRKREICDELGLPAQTVAAAARYISPQVAAKWWDDLMLALCGEVFERQTKIADMRQMRVWWVVKALEREIASIERAGQLMESVETFDEGAALLYRCKYLRDDTRMLTASFQKRLLRAGVPMWWELSAPIDKDQ